MNILFVTQSDPRATGSGAAQRTHLLWEALGRIGTVYTVVTVGPMARCTDVPEERIRFVAFNSPNRLIWFLQRAVIVTLNVVCWPFRSRQLIRQRIGWPEVSFDCVVTRYVKAAAEVAAWKLAPCYVDIDDLPTESYLAVAAGRHSWIRRCVSRILIGLWTRYVLCRCAGAWLPNSMQIGKVTRFCPCGFLPNLSKSPSKVYCRNGKQTSLLMTVGLMAYEPNYEGIDWFLKTVWPMVRKRFPDLTYAIAGKGVPEAFRTRWEGLPGVKVLGFVEDLEALYASAIAVVTPIRSGAGTCIKVLEACVYGRRNFAAPPALRGLSPQDIKVMGASTFEDAEQFLADLSQWLELGPQARANEQDRIAEVGIRYASFEVFQEAVRSRLSPSD